MKSQIKLLAARDGSSSSTGKSIFNRYVVSLATSITSLLILTALAEAAQTRTNRVLKLRKELVGETHFATLINKYGKGQPQSTPWAGFWWPYTSNGIASGYHAGANGQSPAGKYDAARGGTTLAQDWEVKNHGVLAPGAQAWWGHDNGWSAAAILFPEPKQPVRVNGITFTVADVKALLSEAAMITDMDFYGNGVHSIDEASSPKYDDVSPNQYFLVLTNYMGMLKQGVAIDRYTGNQVWNQPLAAYRFEYPNSTKV
jgi:hypothetical protein